MNYVNLKIINLKLQVKLYQKQVYVTEIYETKNVILIMQYFHFLKKPVIRFDNEIYFRTFFFFKVI